MRNVTDAQQSTLIGVVAKVPVPEARKVLLAKVERRLPPVGSISDEQFAEVINAALASFTPGQYVAAGSGWRDRDAPHTSLKEAADAYLRLLRDDGSERCWPPLPLTPEQRREATRAAVAYAAEREKNASPEERRQAAAEYARFLGGDEAYERVLREQPEPVVEVIWDPTQPPPDRPVLMDMPPENIVRADNIADLSRDGSVEPDAVEDELPSPYFSDWGAPGRDNRGRPLKSAYAEVSELSKRRKRGGLRRLRDISKVFFK